MFGALVALIVFFVGGAVVFFIIVGAIAAAGRDKPVAFEKGSYLVFNMSVNITDAPPPFDKAALMRFLGGDEDAHTMQLRDITRSLRAAAKDDRIAGVFLTGHVAGEGYGSGFAALKEVRAALAEVKAAGKPVVAYLDEAMTRDMYLASVADDLALDPFGMILMPGLASEAMFYTGAMEKFGIGVQITRVGKYKSYVEPFIRKDMSPENREQLQKLLDDLWGDLVTDVCTSRGITKDQFQSLIDRDGVIRADTALKNKIVSRVAYLDQVLDDLKARTGRKGSSQPFKQVSLSQYATTVRSDTPPDAKVESAAAVKIPSGGKIAIVYAEGAIVDGKGELDEIGAERFSRELRQLREDDSVKAIVLRVNSPGGSAAASEVIQREIRLAKKVKPFVVSMGSYAASGGYWISAYGDRIFAEPTTITGSIGVFGILFNVQKLTGDLGLTFDTVKTGKFADVITISRPKTPEEMAVFQSMVDWIYGQFIAKVADGRKLDRSKVEEIAQGRVWSGSEAVKLGLVDEMGDLDAAIRYAAQKAGLGEHYRLTEFPRKKELAEAIAEAVSGVRPAMSRSSGVVSQLLERVRSEGKMLEQFDAPNGTYARLPVEIRIR